MPHKRNEPTENRIPLSFDEALDRLLSVDAKKLPTAKRQRPEPDYPLKATITKTGEDGRMLVGGNFWHGQLEDGTAVKVHLTARVRTLKRPTLQIGQVVRVNPINDDPLRCAVAVSDVQWVSPSKLPRLAKKKAVKRAAKKGKANRSNQAKG